MLVASAVWRSSVTQLEERGCNLQRAQPWGQRRSKRTSLGLDELGVVCRLPLAVNTQIRNVTRRFFFCCSGKSLSYLASKRQ